MGNWQLLHLTTSPDWTEASKAFPFIVSLHNTCEHTHIFTNSHEQIRKTKVYRKQHVTHTHTQSALFNLQSLQQCRWQLITSWFVCHTQQSCSKVTSFIDITLITDKPIVWSQSQRKTTHSLDNTLGLIPRTGFHFGTNTSSSIFQ